MIGAIDAPPDGMGRRRERGDYMSTIELFGSKLGPPGGRRPGAKKAAPKPDPKVTGEPDNAEAATDVPADVAAAELVTAELAAAEVAAADHVKAHLVATELAATELAANEQVAAALAANEQAATELEANQRAAAELAANERAAADRMATEQAAAELAMTRRASAEAAATRRAAAELAASEKAAARRAAKAREAAEQAAAEQAAAERAATETVEAEKQAAERTAAELAANELAAAAHAAAEMVGTERATADLLAAEPAAAERESAGQAAPEMATAGPVDVQIAATERTAEQRASTELAASVLAAELAAIERGSAGLAPLQEAAPLARVPLDAAPAHAPAAVDRFWLKNYPPGVPAEIDVNQYRSLGQLLENAFVMHGSAVAYTCMGVDMTYHELDAQSAAIGAWLQDKGLGKGSRVAIMMPNVLQYPIVLAGALRAGCTVVNVNPLYTPRELEHQLKDSGAEAIFILENFATTLQQVIDLVPTRIRVVCAMGDRLGLLKGTLVNFVVRKVKKLVPAYELAGAERFNDVLARGAALRLAPVELGLDDVAFLQYTGGTTGLSKGAVLLHRNIVANVLQGEAWYQPALARLKPGEQITTVTALPLYHVFALTACALLGMRTGGRNVLIPNPRDIPAFVEALRRQPFNMLPAVNTLFNALLNNEAFRQLDFSHLILSLGGGMAVQQVVAERWLKLTGCPICEAYGLSETSPGATCNPTDTDRYTGTIGLPLPSTDIVILDEAGGRLPPGSAGEIAIRGPQVMAGYWQQPEETAHVMTADGFFRTGDIGIMDEQGYTRIVDRKKDMILVSGFNVYPNEVEGVIAQHPGVLEAAVIGVPDESSGEAVKLFVVRKDPALTEVDLMAFCKEHLTGYKKPRFIEFRAELPKSNVGKVLRRELREPKKVH
jgi:long-chain acyl-CoA synthetase